MAQPLILSVDLDEWFHCPWYTGLGTGRWPSVEACLLEYYGQPRPPGEIVEPTRRLLELFRQRGVSVTFFVLGEVAEWYPDLVRDIARSGHELACHGQHHQSPTLVSREQFARELAKARATLEHLSGRRVVGFRAPNLEIPSWLSALLVEQGFVYDSSVCPSRSVLGKYKNPRRASAPVNPYRTSRASIFEPGDAPLIEVAIPSFPMLRLPGAVSIATRLFGWGWTWITLEHAMRTGPAGYYLHPYELAPRPKLSPMPLVERLFFRRVGDYLYRFLEQLLTRYNGRVVSVEQLLRLRTIPVGEAAVGHV